MDLKQLAGATPCIFSKGEWLIRPGERVENVYYILSGFCIGIITNESGNEYLYDEIPCDAGIHSVALLGMLFDNNRISVMGSIALSEIHCYRIPAESMITYLRHHPDETFQFISKLMHLYVNNVQKHNIRCEKKTIERLCQYLVEHSREEAEGLVYRKDLTNDELAKYLGIHAVTLSRMFSGLKEHGYIRRIRHGWQILDLQALVDCMRGLLDIPYRR